MLRSFGRRQGRALRATRAHAMAVLLERYGIEKQALKALSAQFSLSSTARESARGERARTTLERFRRLEMEIGFGGGEHLAFLARHHPDSLFLGCDPYINGVASLCARIERDSLDNIRVWPDDVRLIFPHFAPACLARVWVLFPDPWPKARHHKRRLVDAGFVDALARLLKPQGALHLASDDDELMEAMRLVVQNHNAFIEFIEEEEIPATRYAMKAQSRGRQCRHFRAVRR